MIIPTRKNKFFYLFIILITLTIYSNSFNNSFQYDDFHAIVNNPAIKSSSNLTRFFFDPQLGSGLHLESKSYRPLLMVSFLLNYLIGGLNVFSFHIMNFLIHLLCSFLVFSVTLFFLQITYGKNDDKQTHHQLTALFAALIFAVHPIQVESVTYITGRSSSLTALFFLLSFWSYVRFGIKDKIYLLFFSMVNFALALLVKETAITLILILVIFNVFFPIGRTIRNRIYTLIPHFLIAAIYIIIRIYFFGSLKYSSQPVRPIYENILTQSKAWIHAIGLLILPLNLNVDYDIPISRSILDSEVLFSFFILISIFIIIWKFSKSCRPIGFFALWFTINLAPTSSVIPLEDLITDRWLYLPVVGFVAILAFSMEWLYRIKISTGPRSLKWIFIFFCALLIEFYGFQTALRNFTWSSYWTLWEDAAEKSPQKWRPHVALGLALNAAGFSQEAIHEFKKAISLNPHAGEAYLNIGHIYFTQGKYEDAIPFFQKAMQLRPRLAPVAHNNLGALYFNIGKKEEAFKELKEALRERPIYARPHYNFGLYYINVGEYDKAIEHLEKAIQIEPEFLPGHKLLIMAYEKKGLKEKIKEANKKYLRYAESSKIYLPGE